MRRALVAIRGCVGVVPDEPVSGAGHLQGDRSEQHDPEEQVQPQQLADEEDRDAEHREQHQQDESRDRRQALVAVDAAGQQSAIG